MFTYILWAVTVLIAVVRSTPTSVPSGRYLIGFNEGVNVAEHVQWARDLHERNFVKRFDRKPRSDGVETVFRRINAYVGHFDVETIEELKTSPDVTYVELDQQFELFDASSSNFVTQQGAPWGLGLISHRDLNTTDYIYDSSAGEGHYAYVLDSGINVEHVEFGGRASLGYNAVGSPEDHIDDTGHGTHVAGTIGSTTYGVAKRCNLISVKITNVTGLYFSALIDGLDWALDDMITNNRLEKSVVNISGGGPTSTAVDNAVRQAYQSGMTIVAAAGNGNRSASYVSPAGALGVIAVASVDRSKKRAVLSNYGGTIDIFAPGEDTLSTWIGNSTATHVTNGTSMASPHVAGTVLYLQKLEGLTTPDQVLERLVELSVKDVVQDAQGSPNRLLYTGAA
ncbi:hypothetical protein N0V83_000010 [Neocucurbitaria cava]|uniref:Uncharacterized protein n=1 Tax=Neocucurbitaria cava TaxID=798079 RepID=A0A9W8YFX9_9PLEO|nr:hypothetical protein N0V83_000010 [Neocucurbitaria cava]